MYKFCYLFLIAIAISCQTQTKETKSDTPERTYPDAINQVFDAHGGITAWNEMVTMSYEIAKEGQNEKQIIDLRSRNERIEAANFTMGYDGSDFWVEADTTYQGNPIFYKNLMFYFYAMPFVLGDPGIIFSETADLVHDSISYPGLRISYESEVGVSPEDEYFLHYDADTHEMEGLGYTVTYFSKEKSTSIKWIRYDDWQTIKGLKLPNSLAWYNLADNLPTTERSRREFVNVLVGQEALPSETFAKTEGAKVVQE